MTGPFWVVISLLISLAQILWTFSIYLESVAILPQLFMISKTGEAETITTHYLFFLGLYRALYLANWIRRYQTENFYDQIAVVSGVVQTIFYCDFFYLYVTKVLKGKKLSLPVPIWGPQRCPTAQGHDANYLKCSTGWLIHDSDVKIKARKNSVDFSKALILLSRSPSHQYIPYEVTKTLANYTNTGLHVNWNKKPMNGSNKPLISKLRVQDSCQEQSISTRKDVRVQGKPHLPALARLKHFYASALKSTWVPL